MQTNQILSASLNDIIFDDRNKSYGAYELRTMYEQRVKRSLLITITIVSLAVAGTVFGSTSTPPVTITKIDPGLRIIDIDDTPPELPKPQVELPPQQRSTPQQQVIFVEPTIVKDEDFTEGMPDQTELKVAVISSVTVEGEPPTGFPAGPENIDGGTDIVQEKIIKDDSPLSIVEIEAKFTGNWENFLRKNLNPEVPLNNDAPPGSYTVLIQFVVDIDGSVSDIKALSSAGYGMEQEAIRVFKKAAKWEPAIMNGFKVKAYRKQPITFMVMEE